MTNLACLRPTPARRLLSAVSDVRNLAVLATLGTLSATVGCSDDTGIIIEVTRDAEKSPDGIVELVFYVGTPMEGDVPSYLRDPSDADTVLLDDGRDLLVDPYRMLIHPSDGFDAEVGAFVLGYTAGRGEVAIGALSSPVPFLEGTITVWPVKLESNGRIAPTDTGCLSWTPNEGGEQIVVSPDDLDCDADPNDTDCAPADPTVGHGQPENCQNGIDDNCNDDTDEPNDLDGDTYFDCEDDCNDNDGAIHPAAEEQCDGIDNDCDGDCDVDKDGDDYTSCTNGFPASDVCFQPAAGDCNDADEFIHPDQLDDCELGDLDTSDSDCDELCDEDADADGDTFTPCGGIAGVCGPQSVFDIDCDDGEEHMFPGNEEICDGLDNDCDQLPFEVPEGAECFGTAELSGSCHTGTLVCVDFTGGPDPGFVCEVENNAETLVPPELCDAFENCVDQGATDPFTCAVETAELNAVPVSCTIVFSSESQDICQDGAAVLPLPAGDPALCGWRILGRPLNDAYQVAVGDDGPVGSSINVCDFARFFTIASAFSPPIVDEVLLWQHGGPTTTLGIYRLTLNPLGTTGECPQDPLICNFDM
jgi:hypothetical protein